MFFDHKGVLMLLYGININNTTEITYTNVKNILKADILENSNFDSIESTGYFKNGIDQKKLRDNPRDYLSKTTKKLITGEIIHKNDYRDFLVIDDLKNSFGDNVDIYHRKENVVFYINEIEYKCAEWFLTRPMVCKATGPDSLLELLKDLTYCNVEKYTPELGKNKGRRFSMKESQYNWCFYQGTNTKAYYMSKEERERAYELCKTTANLSYNFLLQHLIEKGVDEKDLDDLIGNINYQLEIDNKEKANELKDQFDNILINAGLSRKSTSLFRMYRQTMYKNELYQYGCIYLTSDLSKAIGYAKRGRNFGEIQWVAEGLHEEAYRSRDFYSTLNDEQIKLQDEFFKFSDTDGKAMIITYCNIPLDYLLTEDGREIDMLVQEKMFIDGEAISVRVKPGTDITEYICNNSVIDNA